MKILVVEDDIKIATFLKKGLEEEFYSVDIVDNGEDALYLCDTNKYDLLLLDIMIPAPNGLEVCKILRNKNIQTPIIILSAKNSIEDKVEGLSEGADDYLTKPFSFEELLARIKVQFRKNSNKSNVLQIDNLVLDLDKKVCFRGERKIELTSKEYALLEYFLRHQENLISSENINENIWNLDESTASNIVNVYIYRLRNKIDKNEDVKLLHTIRGLGYKIQIN